jgi:hypothetical protein
VGQQTRMSPVVIIIDSLLPSAGDMRGGVRTLAPTQQRFQVLDACRGSRYQRTVTTLSASSTGGVTDRNLATASTGA